MSNPSLQTDKIQTGCCIVGGGPAGMMLGLLLARSGVQVIVLEKHADFFRDFRGDTIHPSTLELLHELGCLEEFLKLPHDEVSALTVCINGRTVPGPDFSALPTHCKFIAFTPQWHFLNFIAQQAQRYPNFSLRMETDVVGLLEDNGRITGVRAHTPQHPLEIRTPLVIGADGRNSTIRVAAGLEIEEFGVPIDVLWMHLPKTSASTETGQSLGHFRNGRMMILIDRGDYWQAGHIIHKGELETIRLDGLDAFKLRLLQIIPSLSESLKAIDSWDKVKLLTVQVNRLLTWSRPGLLCIGDCAHAMSPAGGIGVNIAIQDAVATANLLADKLREGTLTTGDLHLVQKHREWAIRWTQALQLFLHRKLLNPQHLGNNEDAPLPLGPRLLGYLPLLRRLIARVVGLGFLPEHVQTKEIASKR